MLIRPSKYSSLVVVSLSIISGYTVEIEETSSDHGLFRVVGVPSTEILAEVPIKDHRDSIEVFPPFERSIPPRVTVPPDFAIEARN